MVSDRSNPNKCSLKNYSDVNITNLRAARSNLFSIHQHIMSIEHEVFIVVSRTCNELKVYSNSRYFTTITEPSLEKPMWNCSFATSSKCTERRKLLRLYSVVLSLKTPYYVFIFYTNMITNYVIGILTMNEWGSKKKQGLPFSSSIPYL